MDWMKHFFEILVLTLVLSAFCFAPDHSRAQGTMQPLTITFENPPDVPPPGAYVALGEYFESDVWFRKSPGTLDFELVNGIGLGVPVNGTIYLQRGWGGLLFSRTSGALFDLVSVDLAEGGANPTRVGFVGYRQDGMVVTAEFTTDGIFDGSGPLADFETFHFGLEFSGLSYVEIPLQPPFTSYSLDNVVILVPEPVTSAFLLVGVFLFLARRFHRNK